MNVLSLFSGIGGLVEAGGNAVVPQVAEHIGCLILGVAA